MSRLPTNRRTALLAQRANRRGYLCGMWPLAGELRNDKSRERGSGYVVVVSRLGSELVHGASVQFLSPRWVRQWTRSEHFMKTKTKKSAPAKKLRSAASPVVHFEIVGKHPRRLQQYYARLFGWSYDLTTRPSKKVSRPAKYGFIDLLKNAEGTGIRGGIGGGRGHSPHTLVYIGVANVAAALKQAEKLGGRRKFGPVLNEAGNLAVGQFLDPEGNLVGVAGPA